MPRPRQKASKGGKKRKRPAARKAPSSGFAAHDVFNEEGHAGGEGEAFGGAQFEAMKGGSYEYTFPEAGTFQDEDIDSDQAFNSEDEAKYGQFFSGATRKGKRRRTKTADSGPSSAGLDMLNESDEGEGEGGESDSDGEGSEAGDYVGISELLASSEVPLMDGLETSIAPELAESDEEEASSGDSDEDGGGEGDGLGDRHDKMLSAVSAIARKGRSVKSVRNEARTESEFHLHASKATVSVDDLLGSLGDTAAYGGLKKQLSKLGKSALKLSKPADKHDTAKATRKVAYKEAKKELGKWVPTVKRNREADTVSFPLHEETAKVGQSTAALASSFKPQTELEQAVTGVLDASATVEHDLRGLSEAEAAALQAMPPAEARARRKELQRMRVLQSSYENKCKRIKKIKSKKYHQLLKKQTKRRQQADKPEELDPAVLANQTMKAEEARAQERATLRHKNQSAWAKKMLKRRDGNTESRQAVGEMLEMDSELRRKVTLRDSEADDSSSDDGDEEFDAEKAAREVQELDRELHEGGPEATGVFAMRFMQKSIARRKKAAQQELAELRDELLADTDVQDIPLLGDEAGAAEDETRADLASAFGRRKFGPKRGKRRRVEEGGDPEGEEAAADDGQPSTGGFKSKTVPIPVRKASKKGRASAAASGAIAVEPSENEQPQPEAIVDAAASSDDGAEDPAEVAEDDDDGENPWLRAFGNEKGLTPTEAMDQFTRKAAKRQAKLQRRSAAADKKAGKETTVSLDALQSRTQKGKIRGKGKGTGKKTKDALDAADVDDSVVRDTGTHDRLNLNAQGSEEQTKLIQEAFAGDNVVEAEFKAEKEALVEKETPKDVDLTLPGWGTWGGEGIADPYPKRRIIKKAPKAKPRKDKDLQFVIINEKRDKKLAALSVSNLPFPFTSVHQFERSISQPLGKDWHTDTTFRKLSQPKIKTKAGKIIAPMKLTKDVERAAERRQESMLAQRNKRKARKASAKA